MQQTITSHLFTYTYYLKALIPTTKNKELYKKGSDIIIIFTSECYKEYGSPFIGEMNVYKKTRVLKKTFSYNKEIRKKSAKKEYNYMHVQILKYVHVSFASYKCQPQGFNNY